MPVNHLEPGERARAREYLEARSIPVTECGCRLWLLAERSSGYGAATWNAEQWDAHVLSYEAHVGRVPRGMLVEHCCDTPMCVEPSHLRAGTKASNAAHASQRDRLRQKLSTSDVRAIRARIALDPRRGVKLALAREYGVAKSMITHIATGREWRYA